MDGGDGFDTYVIEAGDGNDVIIDNDGIGEVIYGGATLTGTATIKEGKYTSEDGKLSYSFAGDIDEGASESVPEGRCPDGVDAASGALRRPAGLNPPAGRFAVA